MSDLQQGTNQITDAASLRAAREIAYAEFKKTLLFLLVLRSGFETLICRKSSLSSDASIKS